MTRSVRAGLLALEGNYTETSITGLLNELIAEGDELRRRINVGKTADEPTWKYDTIDWLRSTELFTRKKHSGRSAKVIPDHNTDINLFRMLIAHQLADLKHFKESRSPPVQR